MERRNNTVSSSGTYFFQILPQHLKVEHGFAKSIKHGTSYRLAINRGFQKVDQFSTPIKAKLMGGKISFENRSLAFSLTNFTPTRNIEYTIKLLEAKPGEEEKQIAQHKIKSGDYVKKFQGDQTCKSQQEVELIENLGMSFDIFVHSSQQQLENVVQRNRPKEGRVNAFARKKEEKRDSSRSSQRKLSRKRGHDGKLRSREGSEASKSQHSRSSRRSGRFMHKLEGQHFIRNNKKASPPKVEGTQERKSLTGGGRNLVTAGMREEGRNNRSRTPERLRPDNSKGKKPVHDLEFRVSDKFVDLGKRGASSIASPKNNQEVGKSSGTQPGRFNRGAASPPSSQVPRVIPGRAGGSTSPRQGDSEPGQVHDLVMKGTENVFDIVKRGHQGEEQSHEAGDKQASKSYSSNLTGMAGKGKGARGSAGDFERGAEGRDIPQSGVYVVTDEAPIATEEYYQKEPKMGDITTSVKPQRPERSIKSRDSKQAPSLVNTRLKPTVQIGGAEIGTRKSRQIIESQAQQAPSSSNTSDLLFYIVFVVISFLLFWNAITPSRRV